MKIIAFGHDKHVGKDTAAKILARYLRLNTTSKDIRVSGFAHEVKLDFYKAFQNYGVKPPSHYEEYPEEKDEIIPSLDMTYRQGLIKFANAYRAIDPDYWITRLFEKHAKADYLIIPDLRFENEFWRLVKLGGLKVKITRTGFGGDKDGADEHLAHFTLWDHVIENTTIAEFTKVIEKLGALILQD